MTDIHKIAVILLTLFKVLKTVLTTTSKQTDTQVFFKKNDSESEMNGKRERRAAQWLSYHQAAFAIFVLLIKADR